MAVSAKQIIDSINQRRLPYKADHPPTPGDGNCFIHAVLQQLRRPEFGGDFSELLQTVDHKEFRVRVRDFIISSESQAVQTMKEQLALAFSVGIGTSWPSYWTNIVTQSSTMSNVMTLLRQKVGEPPQKCPKMAILGSFFWGCS